MALGLFSIMLLCRHCLIQREKCLYYKYVEESYRHQGIGSQILERLIHGAKEKDYTKIVLSASKVGHPLYEKYGFEDIQNSMLLNLQ